MSDNSYNSMLYGNGLTLAILDQITNKFTFPIFDRFLDFNTFFSEFIHAEEHKRIVRDFHNYFAIDKNTSKTHSKSREFLIHHEDEFLKLGFERWASKYLFDEKGTVSKEITFYVHTLYNYWYHVINQNILLNPQIDGFLNSLSEIIKEKVISFDKIFTLNFDTLLDRFLMPRHLHGEFVIPLYKMKNIILHFLNDEFEYKFLFGSNGIEKLSRIDKIKHIRPTTFNFDFFYDSKLCFDHLLIYGIGFNNTEFMSSEFLEKYPENMDKYYAKTVDGHILSKLNQMYESKRIHRITLSYYSQDDLNNFRNLISLTEFYPIVEFEDCQNIFCFSTVR